MLNFKIKTTMHINLEIFECVFSDAYDKDIVHDITDLEFVRGEEVGLGIVPGLFVVFIDLSA